MSEDPIVPPSARPNARVDDRKIAKISIQELERRWKLVREHMARRCLDALITQTARDFTGGYVKWFTDIPAYYPRTVMFHRADLMTVVEHGPSGRKRSPRGFSSKLSRGHGASRRSPPYTP